MKFYLIFAGTLVGFIAAIQFQSQLLPSRDTTINEQEDIQAVYQELQQEQNRLKVELESLRAEEQEKLQTLTGDIQSELEEAQKNAGFTKASGAGISIRLIPNNNVDTVAFASYLRNIKNLLLNMNAEAIAVNGYRIVFKTPIVAVGDSILLKNFHISAPFEVQAIGNADFILSALEVKESFKDIREAVTDELLKLEVQKLENLEIPAYIY